MNDPQKGPRNSYSIKIPEGATPEEIKEFMKEFMKKWTNDNASEQSSKPEQA